MPALDPTPTAFMLDLDGTLVDTLGDFVAVLNRVMADMALPAVQRDFIEHTIGQGSEHLIRSVLAEAGAPQEHYEQAWALYQRHYEVLNGEHADVFPGVIEGLNALKALGLPMACLTNKPAAFARELLSARAWTATSIVSSAATTSSARSPIRCRCSRPARRSGQRPRRPWMIGDSSNDARAAHAAGCPIALVSYGYNHGQPIREVPAERYIDRLDELLG